MQKYICIFLVLLFLAGCNVMPAPKRTPHEKLYGAWVATTYNLDYPSQTGLSTRALKDEAIRLLDGAKELGLNAIFLQVRPCGDAIYPSKYYPWSQVISGKQGVRPDHFDPLEFWVEEAHKRGIELHAWINPFRITQGGKIDVLCEDNVARQHPEWTVKYKDGNLYLNPGIPEVREYIKNGIREILDNYKVDGIHFDDYFYPGGEFNDDVQYKGSNMSRADWRRDNVNIFVKETADLVRKKGAMFGISPFAIWRNADSTELGSNTHGLETYDAHYADTRKWVKEGWVDYIAPQIYWNIGNHAADYETLLNWWCDIVRDTDVALYIGHAGYRTEEAQKGDIWYGADELKRQMKMNKDHPEVNGSIHFRLGVYLNNEKLNNALKEEYIEVK